VLSAREERRFKIWQAMQEAIEWLAKAILSFNSPVPEWRQEINKPLPSFTPTKTFEDLIARLVDLEINTVQDRMIQLVQFMEDHRFPGTTRGQPRLEGPPSYQSNWDALHTARVYALLCRDHWYDELHPEAPRKARLPLRHPPLLHALRRETGNVPVPVINPSPPNLWNGGV
jgi:hypothetical protein